MWKWWELRLGGSFASRFHFYTVWYQVLLIMYLKCVHVVCRLDHIEDRLTFRRRAFSV